MPREKQTDEGPLLATWQAQMQHATKNPFLFQLLLKQWQRILKRLAYFYAQLASLPRRNRRALQRALATSLIGAAMLLALSSAPVVHANNITVSGACTLDEAITNANNDAATFPDCAAGSGADTIYLTGNVTIGVDTPAAALPFISSAITLEGNNFSVSGNNAFRVFGVNPGGNFTVNDTTVTGGHTTANGGGIFNEGTLEVNNSTIRGNYAYEEGAGIFNYDGSLTVNNSTLSGNNAFLDGGGLYNDDGTLTVNNSTVSGNTAGVNGGGIYNKSGTLIVNNSTLSGNTAREGGGIYNYSGTLTVNNSTLSGNSAGDGGGIYNQSGTVNLNRSLLSGNTATDGGDEVFTIGNDFIGNNFNLLGQSGATNAQAFYGFIPGANDITATSDGTMPATLASILDPTLALNGNPNGTLTLALVTGSPALDKAPNAACLLPPINGIDQRGFPRNVDIEPPPTANDCDIGAFELQATTAVNVTNVRGIAKDDKNVLKWRTTSESQVAGFNVYRKMNGQWTMHNAQFIPAKHAGSVEGANYRFADKKVNEGKTHRYRLEVKYLDGHSEWTSVVRVKTP